MNSDKFALEINWKAGKQTLVLSFLSIATTFYTPFLYHENYTISAFLFLILQLGISVGIIIFFYGGVSRGQKIRAWFALLSVTSLLGVVSNVTNQSFIMIGQSTLIMDAVALGVINICATFTTLSFTKIQKVSIDRDGKGVKLQLTKFEKLAKSTNPMILALMVFFGSAILGVNPPTFLEDRSFSVTLPFFFFVQLGTTLILTNNFFSDAKGNKKSRIYFSILSLALLLGAIANHQHDQVVLRIGNRIDINTITFLVMNLGGLFTTLAFHFWKDYTESLNEKLHLYNSQKATT